MLHVLSGDLWAGAEVMAFNLLSAVSARNECAPAAVVLNKGHTALKLMKSGVDVHVLDETVYSFQKIVCELRRIIKSFQPQIIHAHRYKENLACYLASRGLRDKISLVSTQHGLPEKYGYSLSVKGRIISLINFLLLSRFFHAPVSVSEEIKTFLESGCGFRSGRIRVIQNGIFLPTQEAGKSGRDEFVIGSCGRLSPVKNYKLFIDIAKIVRGNSEEPRFLLAGEGPEKNRLAKLCSVYGLNGCFSMPGHLLDMDSFYRSIDIFINTSWHEGVPMSVLEAMGHGIPVIAPDVGGFPEIIDHGIDGFLIPGHSPGLFADRCIELHSDRAKLERMSAAARKKIERRFSVHRMAEDYIRLYHELASA